MWCAGEGGRQRSKQVRRRNAVAVEAERRWRERTARLAGEIRKLRRRRSWSQTELGVRAGVDRNAVSRLERGLGRVDLELLDRVAIALGVSLVVAFGRDPQEDVADAGHLAMQNLVLQLARACGLRVQFELPTRASVPGRSVDVFAGSDRRHEAVDIECWNTFGDVGAGVRSSHRKVADLEQAAVGRWGADARAGLVWVVRDTARNHDLVRRYPEVFAAAFPGSSRAWIAALTAGAPMPDESGLVWCDLARGRLHAWRRG
jgi:transcriptional regulator with XRE-family HTH domain